MPCRMCVHWKQLPAAASDSDNEDAGNCIRYPPVFKDTGHTSTMSWVFPITSADTHCGEFKQPQYNSAPP